ncbi:hypothetical protein NOC27_383 [Nitrosococcus oceani AFC27]|nr:hypothetical protein NOC27_383 [Nitrosococcus oceani AFC27]
MRLRWNGKKLALAKIKEPLAIKFFKDYSESCQSHYCDGYQG